jgi:hypothetical protein
MCQPHRCTGLEALFSTHKSPDSHVRSDEHEAIMRRAAGAR